MKKITEDLKITGIDISIARLGATVTFKYLDEYEARAWYLRQSSGNQWLEFNSDVPERIHEAITLEVEENEEEILTWVEEQFAKETDQVDPEKESYNILQLQKMTEDELIIVAREFNIDIAGMGYHETMYKILEEQAKS